MTGGMPAQSLSTGAGVGGFDLRPWVRGYLGGILGLPQADIELNRTLDSYGLDSIEGVIMAGELEEKLGVEIDPGAFLQFATIEAMVVAFERDGTLPVPMQSF